MSYQSEQNVQPLSRRRAFNGISINAAAESSNAREVTVQLQESGNNVTERVAVTVYVSNATGALQAALTGFAVSTSSPIGFLLQAITSNRILQVVTNDQGQVKFTVNSGAGANTRYIAVVDGNGRVLVSEGIAFT